jgi:hypothetical protein
MAPIAVLAAPANQEVHVATGRLSTSVVNDLALVGAVLPRFEVDGAVSVAAMPDVWVNDYNVPLTVTKVVARVGTAPVGAALVVNVLIDGVSVYAAAGDRVTIADAATSGENVPNKTGEAIILRPGQALSASVTQVGSGTAGSDLALDVHLA